MWVCACMPLSCSCVHPSASDPEAQLHDREARILHKERKLSGERALKRAMAGNIIINCRQTDLAVRPGTICVKSFRQLDASVMFSWRAACIMCMILSTLCSGRFAICMGCGTSQ